LDDCLHRSGNFERLFWLTAYRHYDRENDNILKTAQWYLLYRKIKHPNSFAQLCQKIKTEVLSDMINRFAVSKDTPSAADLTVIDIKGQTVPLINSASQKNKSSTIVLFFSVTCHNCIDEMNTLSKMSADLRQRNINIVGIYTMFNNPQTVVDELKSFQTAHNYPFPTFIDPNRSSISSRYGITSVPSIMFVRDDGSLAGLGSLNHYGHLHEKFSALFSLFD
jgi:peroxiredoxin